jgi:hypothetical protein
MRNARRDKDDDDDDDAREFSQLTGATVASRKRDGVVGFTGRRGASESYQCGDPAAAGQRPLLSTKSTVTVCVFVWQCPPPYYNNDIHIYIFISTFYIIINIFLRARTHV